MPQLPPVLKELVSKIQLPAAFSPKKPQKIAAPKICLACDFGKSKIVFLEVEKSDQGIKLLKFQKIPRPVEKEKDSAALNSAFENGKYNSRKVRISVKGQGVIIRFVQFPQMKPEELRNAISFEIDQYIPFKSHEVIWDFHILEENLPIASGAGMNVLLSAVKRDELYATLKIFQEAGLEVELIDVDALAAINALNFFYPERLQNPAAILDIGTEISTLSVAHLGKPRFIRDISFGGLDILKRLKRKLGLSQEQALQQIEVDQAPTPEATDILKEALGDLVTDLKVSLNYYLDQTSGATAVKQLFVGGGGGYHPIVTEILKNSLGFEVEAMDVLGKVQIAPEIDAVMLRKNQGLLPVSLGLLIRSI